MRKIIGKNWMLLVFAVYMIVTFLPGGIIQSVNAATNSKVTKVTAKYSFSDDLVKQRITLYGKTKDGTVVWKYKSEYQEYTDRGVNEYFVNKNTVYLFSGKIYAINKNTGKVKWQYKASETPYGAKATFDSAGNMYYSGYSGEYLWCLSAKGKLKFKTEIPSNYAWVDKIKIKNSKIRVYVIVDWDAEDTEKFSQGKHYLTFSKKGKYLGLDK